MSDATGTPPRVERALRVLPDIAALAPLRAVIMSSSRPDHHGVWASAGPYLTIGKHFVEPADLRTRLPGLLDRIRAHLATLYESVIEALEAEQRGDPGAGAAALMRAAQLEESVGRYTDARHWCEVALPLSGWLQDRRPELGVLFTLGRLCLTLGDHSGAARHYQRAFALAEAESDDQTAIDAAEGLGRVALAEVNWTGAQAWLNRALRLATDTGDAARTAGVEHRLAAVAMERGDLAAAGEHLARARDGFERLGASFDMARVMRTDGRLGSRLGNAQRAQAAYREALAWVRRAGGDPGLEVAVRLDLGGLFLESERYLEAEEEARRAESLAAAHFLQHRLVEVYTCLGRLRGHQRDEMGFVFFEQALELCRSLDGSPLVLAGVYREYAAFRERLGEPAEARELLEQAREHFEHVGLAAQVERVKAELDRLPV